MGGTQKGKGAPMRRVGIIDLGSNTVRLVVYETRRRIVPHRAESDKSNGSDEGRRSGKRPFREIMDKKKVLGLSAYVVDGKLTNDGIAVASEAVRSLLKSASNIGCGNVHVFATAVIRNCKNSKRAAEEIGKGAGVMLDVLSAVDEAHLGFVGATCDRAIEHGTLIDIGGGSTELTAIKGGRDTRDLSIPQGSVSSYAQFVSFILPQPGEDDAIRDAFLKNLSRVKDLDSFSTRKMYGIGGSVRAIGKLHAAAFSGDKHAQTLELSQLKALEKLLKDEPSVFAHAATKAVPERMHTVTPGIIITRTLMERLGAKTLTVCKHGVREGYLLERVLKA